MTSELVRVSTELKLVRSLECRVPNKRALIAALHKVGAVCGAPAHEVSQVIKLLEDWQRADYTERLLRGWSYKGRIAEQSSLSQWCLPTYDEEKREQLPAWTRDLHFRVERQDGEIVLKDLEHKNVAYADFAHALGVDPEPPADRYLVHMALPRVNESWFSWSWRGLALPMRPFMAVLNQFFEEPHVQMSEDERRQYAQKHGMVLYRKFEDWEEEVAPYGYSLDSEQQLGGYVQRRFTVDSLGNRIEFIDYFDDDMPPKARRHPYLHSDCFWVEFSFIHPATQEEVFLYEEPNIRVEDYCGPNAECLLDVAPPLHGEWGSSDDMADTAVIQLTFGFTAVGPHTLAQKQESQRRADEFAAKLREHFEPVMQELQSPPPEEY